MRGRLAGLPDQAHGVGLRLRVRLHRWRLDRELAEGPPQDREPTDAGPHTTVEQRALRASQLAQPATRRALARSLRRICADAQSPRVGAFSSTVPVYQAAVAPWREALLGLAERLVQPVPPSSCGLARLLVLLADGGGPLYNPASERSMGEAIWWVADGLALCSPHRWSCPVVMKLDPERVGWTCTHCGAVATSDDPAVKPA